MQGEPLSQARLDALWASVHQALDDCAWDAAEGLLRRLLQLVPAAGFGVWDTLAYVLLMQGDYRGCMAVLLPRRADPARTFWLQHKLGDAHRGLNQFPEAEACYRHSLAEGSDSPLTCRNLLQVLDGLDPDRAVAELQRWAQDPEPPSPAAWDGARDAAVLVPGLALAEGLWRAGQADAACRQRLLEDACYRLDQARVLAFLADARASADGLSSWERALAQRLERLGLAEASSAPGVGAPQR